MCMVAVEEEARRRGGVAIATGTVDQRPKWEGRPWKGSNRRCAQPGQKLGGLVCAKRAAS